MSRNSETCTSTATVLPVATISPVVPPLTLSVSAVDRRRVTLQFRNRTLTRSNALAVKSPDPPTQEGLGFSPGSSSEFLGVLQDRRHSDSYFPLKRHRRKHQMRGLLHPKYSYSPNPRYCSLRVAFELDFLKNGQK